MYYTQIVGAAAKALVVGQPTVGNSTRQYALGLCRDTSSLIRPKNSKKKLVKSWFRYHRFLSLVIAMYLRLVLLYIRSSREIKILKLIKVLL